MRLQIQDIRFHYDSRAVLEDMTFDATAGEVVGLIGPNGTGKSTLIKCIDRILQPSSGVVLLDGKASHEFEPRELAQTMGYVPQSQNGVFPTTVYETVMLGRKPYITWREGSDDREFVWRILDALGMETLAFRSVQELSGGERQKVYIARALAQNPNVLLLDEPTNNLDLKHQLDVLLLLRHLAHKQGITIIMAVHDLSLAARFTDKLLLMYKGRIHAAGPPAQVLTPENVRTVYGVEVYVHESRHGIVIQPILPNV